MDHDLAPRIGAAIAAGRVGEGSKETGWEEWEAWDAWQKWFAPAHRAFLGTMKRIWRLVCPAVPPKPKTRFVSARSATVIGRRYRVPWKPRPAVPGLRWRIAQSKRILSKRILLQFNGIIHTLPNAMPWLKMNRYGHSRSVVPPGRCPGRLAPAHRVFGFVADPGLGLPTGSTGDFGATAAPGSRVVSKPTSSSNSSCH